MFVSFALCTVVLFTARRVGSVPPDVCFARFRWEDCGKAPVPVMYYWKSGSRCEVGLWRGCLPNVNMFRDEYECVATCIFSARAQPSDYHNYNEIEPFEELDTTPSDIGLEGSNSTETNSTDTNSTDTSQTDEGSGDTESVTTTIVAEGSEADTTVAEKKDGETPASVDGEVTEASTAEENATEAADES